MLEQPPFWPTIVLENPGPLVFALFTGALVVGISAGRQGRKRLWQLAGGLLIAGVGVGLVSRWVVTDRERILQRTQLLVARVNQASPDNASWVQSFDELFAPGATLVTLESLPPLQLKQTSVLLEQYRARNPGLEHRLKDLAAQMQGESDALAQIDVQTRGAGRDDWQPILTRWRLSWQRQPDGAWRITRVQWLEHPLGLKPRPGLLH